MASASEIDLMRHALGVQRKGARWTEACRNHFVAGEDDQAAWEELVRRGLAKLVSRDSEVSGGMPLYCVTENGKAIAHDLDVKKKWRAQHGVTLEQDKS